MQLNGETQLFPIIGDPIAQVRSPQFLSQILAGRGVNAIVPPMQVKPADLSLVMTSLRATQNVGGIVVTIPHKVTCLAHCDEVSERAAFVGSVNIIRKTADGKLVGDNVDGIGYLDGIAKEGGNVQGKRFLLVGVGGAGSAVAFEVLQRGASYLAIHDLNTERRDAIIQSLASKFPHKVGVGSSDPTGFDFVANVTPVGMREGDPYPVDVTKLKVNQFVADAITRPEVSPMVAYARDLGCNTMVGAGMFNAEAEILVDFMTGKV
ncbi:MAG: hypothetical protein WBP46_16355 [Thiolinea sp.]